MPELYLPAAQKKWDLPIVFFWSLLLTLLVFLVLPLTQILSGRRSSIVMVRSASVLDFDPGSEKTGQEPAQPEQPSQQSEPVPALTEAQAPLNLTVDLETAFGSGGALAVGQSLLQDIVAQAESPSAIEVSELDKKPDVLNRIPPVYPDSMRKAKIEGTVVVVFLVDEEGKVW
ncbi:MAG: hypothetical protein N3G20_10355, partial [Verrucomicrobiae bacterium]|nr:hypothetical protein [Verrucomicrobiae bacterium]